MLQTLWEPIGLPALPDYSTQAARLAGCHNGLRQPRNGAVTRPAWLSPDTHYRKAAAHQVAATLIPPSRCLATRQ
ncbi:hypothetical protein CTTA_3261 [Comamonas testosteroni]|uniref:Uncharacterized protein n=1 Tax=Comamonas testosteroni TaxID=285 RepID=A0A5A7MEY9_COMTE|nr:hypothetical protein CTTA_3261 [Comamonas testosteroni]